MFCLELVNFQKVGPEPSFRLLLQVALALVDIYSAPLLHTADEIDAFQVRRGRGAGR